MLNEYCRYSGERPLIVAHRELFFGEFSFFFFFQYAMQFYLQLQYLDYLQY